MSDAGDDDPQLKSLRAVWLSMPDEEPPERGLSELMAAARVKADEMAKPSLWHRITALLRRPPVLALATVLVLIGGAVFIGQRKDKMEVEPTVEPTLGFDRERDVVQPGAGAATTTAPAPAVPPHPDPAAAPAPIEETRQAEPHAAPPPEPNKGAPPRDRPTRRPPSAKPDVTVTRGDGKASKTEDSLRLGGDDSAVRGAVETPKAEQKPKAVEKNQIASDSFAPEATLSEAPTAGASAPTADKAPQPAPSRAPQYVAQAKSAAARGDCAAARTMMKQVAKEDAAVYRKALDSDAALKKCVIVAQ